jgi:hypothetical protein
MSKKGGYSKHILKFRNYTYTTDHRFFYISKASSREDKVILDFGKAVEYRVVKLGRSGLPKKFKGRPVKWVSNFAIKNKSGAYVERVPYTLYLRRRPGRFVYMSGNKIKDDKSPRKQSRAIKEVPHSWVKVVLTLGDPPEGWT